MSTVLEVLGPDAQDHLAVRDVGAGRKRDAELREADDPSLHRRLDEVHRGRADESRDEDVTWLRVEPLRRVDLDDLPGPHDGDTLAERHRLDLVVGDVDGGDAEPLVQLRERGAHADAELSVEVRERLVEQERLGLANDRPAHRDALSLPARELRRAPVEQGRQPEQFGDLVDAPRDLGLLGPPSFQPITQVLAHAHVGVERVGLEDHCDVAILRR